jgi:hypothetical protein
LVKIKAADSGKIREPNHESSNELVEEWENIFGFEYGSDGLISLVHIVEAI